jgi:hypothetical protein
MNIEVESAVQQIRQLSSQSGIVPFEAIPHPRDCAGDRVDYKIVEIVAQKRASIDLAVDDPPIDSRRRGVEMSTGDVVVGVGSLQPVEVEPEELDVVTQGGHVVAQHEPTDATCPLVRNGRIGDLLIVGDDGPKPRCCRGRWGKSQDH